MIALGIDIGLSGALAVVRGEKLLSCEDMPTRLKPGNGLIKREVDARALYELILKMCGEYRAEVSVHLENVYGMRKGADQKPQGSSSVFSFGDTRGAVRAVLEVMKVEPQWIAPQTWKRHFKLDAQKHAARMHAIGLYPEAPLARVKDHNRAEAILIARFGYETQS